MKLDEVMKMKRELSEREVREQVRNEGPITLDENLKSIIESDDHVEVETACGQELLPKDIVDQAIHEWIQRLINSDYYEEDAEQAVFDAAAYLIENGHLPDTPPMEVSEQEKIHWIKRFDKKVYDKLLDMGLEFDI